ncbi:hypothetical protein AOX55_0000261 [Sinorhizobium fredii CCBAU 25509]|nr:hypothetical protein SF83666_c02120 [Sinorhizobium fredii CCBAU 83666]AWM23544.1 hypothetical protein AOX55_0000261 [Sinorhizobium fredii CCBAU 25509]GEC31481.1 hypothetical protein EFR01_16520 [Sinorhizobium fredii]GLS09185.1 hypothetical protein GCM10007864_28150 [Sinorhizobium fredii]
MWGTSPTGQAPPNEAALGRSAANILESIAFMGLRSFPPECEQPANMLAASRVL